MAFGIYAHSFPGKGREGWQALSVHGASVAARAAAFARPFRSEVWAELAGHLHDVGKCRASFQNYLAYSNGLEDAGYDASDHSHSGAGAVWAARNLGPVGRSLAYCVAGHHAGLPDWLNGPGPNGALGYRLVDEPPAQ